jgi:hypothetical protein
METFNKQDWLQKIRAASNMEEVVAIMEEHPEGAYSSMLTDDPMPTITVLQMMSDHSTPTTLTENIAP